MKSAYFAAGCFWGVEAHFRKLKGVVSTSVGYMGGHTENPSYEQVCKGDTGHAETVQINYDADVISYENLLIEFFECHNPTQKDRQGPDLGNQYRSAIFYQGDEQKQIVLSAIELLNNKYVEPIVTQVAMAPKFYKAEDYHQQYFEKHGDGSCNI